MKFQSIKPARLGIAAGTEIFLLGGLAMLFYGKLNMDESWYLYASKLVYHGMVPYRDFAFTQMPLLPYIYGMPQLLLGQSLLVGRATSLFFGLLSFFLALKIAQRYAGTAGAGLTAIFLGTFFFGIYYLTIVKTYALVTFFFMLTFFLLSSELRTAIRCSLAIACIFFAGLTRLSALSAAVAVLIYVLWVAPSTRIRWLALGLFAFLSLLTFKMLTADFPAASWDLLTYHTLPWGDTTPTEKIIAMFLVRPLTFIFWESPYTLYFLLIFLFGLLVLRESSLREKLRSYLMGHREILAMAAGMLVFVLSHLQSGSWHFEYFVPAIFVCLVILSIGCVKVYRQLKTQRAAQTLMAGVVGLSLILSPARQLIPLLDIDDGQTVINRVEQVAKAVSGLTQPEERLIVLEALWISIGSHRDPAPGYTMAQFSYLPVDATDTAQRVKLVNQEILLADLLNAGAKVVIFTDLDWLILGAENTRPVCNALRQNYSLALITEYSRQEHDRIYIYRRDQHSSFQPDSLSDPCARYESLNLERAGKYAFPASITLHAR